MYKLLAMAMLVFSFSVLQAQKVYQGKIVDESGESIPNVSVCLLETRDSSLVKLTLSKPDGSFSFLAPAKKYLLKLTSVNYHTGYFFLEPNTALSEPFVLKKAVKQLADVSVSVTRPLYQFLADKTIVNIDAVPSNAGSTLLDVVQKMPDILVDAEGNISINGKQGAVVMVDGRETFLSGQQLLNMLRNMPAASADQLEIISNPSARYDASFTGGILNIKTQKGKTQGLNGTLSTAAGVQVYEDIDDKAKGVFVTRNNVNYNYRRESLNIYGTTGYDRSFYYENFSTNRYFFTLPDQSPAGSYFSGSHLQSAGDAYVFRIAADVTLTKNHLLGIILNNTWDNNTSSGATNSHVANNSKQFLYLMRSNIINPGSNNFFGNYNINYKYEHPTKNIDVFTDFSFLKYNSRGRTANETKFIDTLNNQVIPPLFRRQDAKNDFVGTVFKTDLIVKKIGGFKLETGYKFSFIRTTNDPVFLRKQANDFEVDHSRTIYFRYKETIHALYAIASRSFKKWESQLGLRLEDAAGKGYQRNNDSSFTRHWLNLFPSFYIKHNATKSYQVIFNYSRKIIRPSAKNLSPFAYFTDSLYSNTGNPYIQPQFAHAIELRQIIRNKLSIVASFQQVSDMIMFMIVHDPQDKTIRATVNNFADYRQFNLSATYSFKPYKAWQASINSAMGVTKASGSLLNQEIDQKVRYCSFSVANVFTISPLWSTDVNLNYTSPQLSGLLKITRPLIYSLGIRRKTKNNLGSFTLSMQTPLMVPKYRIDVAYATTIYDSRFHLANQAYMLTYSVRFGKQTVSQQRTKKNATDEEQNRM